MTMHPPVSITADELAALDQIAPRRRPGRPRKHPEGKRPRYPANRAAPQQKVQPATPGDLARWRLAAAAAGMKLSPWIARAASLLAPEAPALAWVGRLPDVGPAFRAGTLGREEQLLERRAGLLEQLAALDATLAEHRAEVEARALASGWEASDVAAAKSAPSTG